MKIIIKKQNINIIKKIKKNIKIKTELNYVLSVQEKDTNKKSIF